MKWTFTLGFLLLLSGTLFSQTTDRYTFSVFVPVEENDTVLVAGGQVLVGQGEDAMTHGYYPLQQTMLSLPNDNLDLLVSVYPVPFQNQVTIAFQNQSSTLITLEVTDLSGAMLYSKETNQNSFVIHTNTWESGIYVTHLISQEGSYLYSDKIVKI